MSFKWNGEGVEEASTNYSPIPGGVYKLRIVDTDEEDRDGRSLKSKNGDPQVQAQLMVENDCPYKGRTVRHRVTFLPNGSKGAGFTKHWLRVIHQPYEGNVNVNPKNWIGKTFIARVEVESYEDKNGESKETNRITDTWHVDDENIPSFYVSEKQTNGHREAAKAPTSENLETVPF